LAFVRYKRRIPSNFEHLDPIKLPYENSDACVVVVTDASITGPNLGIELGLKRA